MTVLLDELHTALTPLFGPTWTVMTEDHVRAYEETAQLRRRLADTARDDVGQGRPPVLAPDAPLPPFLQSVVDRHTA